MRFQLGFFFFAFSAALAAERPTLCKPATATPLSAFAIANDTEFGLAAWFCSRDVGRIWRVAEGLDFGIVRINEGVISNATAPFGGMRESGNGREGSKYGLDGYLEIKYLCIGGIDSGRR